MKLNSKKLGGGGNRSRSNRAGPAPSRHVKRRISGRSASKSNAPRPKITKHRRNVEKADSAAVFVPFRVVARRLGLTQRKLFSEILLGDLAGVQRPSGLYVNEDELRSFLTPGGKAVQHGR